MEGKERVPWMSRSMAVRSVRFIGEATVYVCLSAKMTWPPPLQSWIARRMFFASSILGSLKDSATQVLFRAGED